MHQHLSTHNVIVGQTPISVTVDDEGVDLLGPNPLRGFCVLTNVGNFDVFIALDNDAEENKGIRLGKQGDRIAMGSEVVSRGRVHAICGMGSSALILIQEGNLV